MKRIAILLALLLSAAPAMGSEDVDSDQWAQMCASTNALAQGWCAATVMGAVGAVERYQRVAVSANHPLVCWDHKLFYDIDEAAPTDDGLRWYASLAKVGIDYLAAHPEYAKLPSVALLLAAFMGRWPC
jgi:hypothetical protein